MVDAEAVTGVFRADEATAGTQAHTTVGDIRSDWNRPSFDLDTAAVVVEDGDRVVAYADQHEGRAWVAVHPDAHGRGIGAWLRDWTERAAATELVSRVGQTIADVDTHATSLLRDAGYAPLYESWVFTIPLDGDLPQPRLADGITLRPMVRPDEDAAVHRVVEDAFAEWPDRDSGVTFEDWRAAHLDRDDVEVLVIADAGEVVGVGVCLDEGEGEGWVEQLAVAASHRGTGLGRALLQGAFVAFKERGCTSAGLSTDSRTGAKAIYEHVGMTVTESYTRWTRTLPRD